MKVDEKELVTPMGVHKHMIEGWALIHVSMIYHVARIVLSDSPLDLHLAYNLIGA